MTFVCDLLARGSHIGFFCFFISFRLIAAQSWTSRFSVLSSFLFSLNRFK
nr:MAG TPA: hypothetical protein [Caudoviricetes sp.]